MPQPIRLDPSIPRTSRLCRRAKVVPTLATLRVGPDPVCFRPQPRFGANSKGQDIHVDAGHGEDYGWTFVIENVGRDGRI